METTNPRERASVRARWSSRRTDGRLTHGGRLSVLLDDDQVSGRVVEDVGPVRGANHDVLDSNPELPGQVDAGLYRECVPGDEPLGVPFHNVGVLVDFETDPVTGPMNEPLAVSSVLDDSSG